MYTVIGINHTVSFHETRISGLFICSSFKPYLNFRSSYDFPEQQQLYTKYLRNFVQGTLQKVKAVFLNNLNNSFSLQFLGQHFSIFPTFKPWFTVRVKIHTQQRQSHHIPLLKGWWNIWPWSMVESKIVFFRLKYNSTPIHVLVLF